MEEDQDRVKRLVVLAGSLGLTALFAYLAFFLGAWAFDTRRSIQHEGRLSRLLPQQPKLDQVVQGLADEGSPLIGSAESPAELERLAARWGGAKLNEVLEKGRRWPRTRVFLAGDMVYFIYFDANGVMRDFSFVSK
jgi:hypothetical protein